MPNPESLLKECEKNVVNTAVAFETILSVLDGLGNFGVRACNEHLGRPKFFEGLGLMRDGVYIEYVNAQRNCLLFTGVGGEDAKAYAKEKFTEQFSGKYNIMRFLDQWGHRPSCFDSVIEEQLKAEAKEAIEKR